MRTEITVYVTVNKVLRAPPTNQPAKDDKSPVTGIFGIMHIPRRGMGYDNVNATPSPQHGQQAQNRASHLPFSILVRSAVVPVRTAQPQDVEASEPHQSAVDIRASQRPFFDITDIVVAANVIEWYAKKVAQKRQILQRQITACQDQIDSGVPTGIDFGIQRWLDNIRHGQNFHDVYAAVNPVDSPAKRSGGLRL
jgi:hypothetical protein